MDLRKLKEKATEAFAKGKFAKAAELYEAYCSGDTKDLQARLRMGDAFAKAGAKEKAIGAYKYAAESYARAGFLPRAIAASKLILELDPTHRGVQQMLADLYAKRGAPDAKRRTSSTQVQAGSPPVAPSHNEIELPREDGPPPPPPIRLGLKQLPVLPPVPETSSPAPPASAAGQGRLGTSGGARVFELNESGELTLDAGGAAAAPRAEPQPEEIIADAVILEPTPAPFPIPADAPAPPSIPPLVSPPAGAAPQMGAVPATSGSAPPGMKPKRTKTGEIPIQSLPPPPGQEVIELTVKKPAAQEASTSTAAPPAAPAQIPPGAAAPPPAAAAPPAAPPASTASATPAPAANPLTASRIWLPEGFTPPPISFTAVEPLGEMLTSQPPPGAPAPAGPPPDARGGEKGSASRFDELDLDMAPTEPLVRPGAAARPAPSAAAPAPRGKPPSVPSFAQMELEGDSLLHAVEMAAQAGLDQREEAPEPHERGDESMSSVAEDFQGETKTPAGLPKIPLFSDLSADAFIELFDRCPLRRFGQGERIIEQGSVGDSFFVICAGAVRVARYEPGGQQKDLAVLHEGAFFGEVALLSGAPRTASVISHSDETQLLEISATVLAQLSHRYPPVAAALKKFCRQRLLANVMNSSPLFKPFNRKDRKDLVERFRARDVKKNDLIIREGHPTDGLYVVLSGEVEVRKGQVRLATLKEGEIFGEMSLLQKMPATATVQASKRTSLLRLPREVFDQVITSHPQVLALISELSETRQRLTEATLSGELLV